MAYWYLVPSLQDLFDEINARWPNRDHASDGAKGDDAHAARVSDHNPDYSAGGVVRAIDVDKDGIDVAQLLDAVVGDPRAAYVIWNGLIASATDDGKPWDWEPYDGSNQHTQHVHISIKHTRVAETDTSPWFPNEEIPLSVANDILTAVRSIQASCARQESALKTLASAEAGRYADIAGRVQTGNDEERNRYTFYAGQFAAAAVNLQHVAEAVAEIDEQVHPDEPTGAAV